MLIARMPSRTGNLSAELTGGPRDPFFNTRRVEDKLRPAFVKVYFPQGDRVKKSVTIG